MGLKVAEFGGWGPRQGLGREQCRALGIILRVQWPAIVLVGKDPAQPALCSAQTHKPAGNAVMTIYALNVREMPIIVVRAPMLIQSKAPSNLGDLVGKGGLPARLRCAGGTTHAEEPARGKATKVLLVVAAVVVVAMHGRSTTGAMCITAAKM